MDGNISQNYETIAINTNLNQSNMIKKVVSPDSVPRIFACATLWHETYSEMLGLLKSLIVMDQDQSARRVARNCRKKFDTDYYEFESKLILLGPVAHKSSKLKNIFFIAAHLFFDDSMEISDVSDDWMQVNTYVQDFVKCIKEAVHEVHQGTITLRPPTKIPTPYGGRLVYDLPGRTKLFVHLKVFITYFYIIIT